MKYYFEGRLKSLIIKSDKYIAVFDSDFYGKNKNNEEIMLVRDEKDKFVKIEDFLECNKEEFEFLEKNKNRKFKVQYQINKSKEKVYSSIKELELIL